MEWTDEGIILGVRRHGESSAIVELLTRGHGRHLGLVRGGAGSRLRPLVGSPHCRRRNGRQHLAQPVWAANKGRRDQPPIMTVPTQTSELVGAGAGGFLMLYAADPAALRQAMSREGLVEPLHYAALHARTGPAGGVVE